MNYRKEFEIVELIVRSDAETRGVDAFALSLIKAERQMRRLVTHLIYQFDCFNDSDIKLLRDALNRNRRVYFEGFELGFNALYSRTVKELVGADYDRLRSRVKDAIDHRNKIFHGQLTSRSLSREDLLAFAADIACWCETLSNSALAEFGYDGFARNSFQKSHILGLSRRYRFQFANVNDYEDFIRRNMQR